MPILIRTQEPNYHMGNGAARRLSGIGAHVFFEPGRIIRDIGLTDLPLRPLICEDHAGIRSS